MTARLRVVVLVAVAAAGVFLAIVALRLATSGDSSAGGSRPATAPEASDGSAGSAGSEGSPDRSEGAVARAERPVAAGRDEAGARAAAIEYATASQRWLHLSDAEIESAVEAISTSEAAGRLADEVVGEVAAAREALAASPGPVWWLVRPLASRVDEFTAERARVSVWTVTVLSAVEVAVPQAEWLTVTVDLEWRDGGWRVAAVDDEAGPTPRIGPQDRPWQAERFDRALEGFERVGEETR